MANFENDTTKAIRAMMCCLVDDPAQLEFEVEPLFDGDGGLRQITIKVMAGEETGKVLGRRGALADATRVWLNAIGAKEGIEYDFRVVGD